METPEFKAAVATMRATIFAAIADAVGTFSAQTGVTPSAITFNMEDVTTRSDAKRVFVLGAVRFRFEDQ